MEYFGTGILKVCLNLISTRKSAAPRFLGERGSCTMPLQETDKRRIIQKGVIL